jgi:hypothetical protein
MTYLFGADPEVFVKQNGQFVTAHNLVSGTKAAPLKVNLGAVQVDGMALEFNIDPVDNEDDWVRNLTGVYHALQQAVPTHELVVASCADFNAEYFKTCPPEAKMLGCDPDFNAWTGAMNEPPQGERPFRTAAGHVHIGWSSDIDITSREHTNDCMHVIKNLDCTLGVLSTLYDKDQRRRELYGAAGAYRPKSYGVEYRVLSNQWLRSETLMRWVFRTAKKTMEVVESGVDLTVEREDKYGCEFQYVVPYCLKDAGGQYTPTIQKKLVDKFGFEAPPLAA